MVELQPIIFSTTRRPGGIFVRIRNRPNYGLEWIARALRGLEVEISSVLHGAEGEWWITTNSTDQDPRVLETAIRQRFTGSDQSKPVFEPPPCKPSAMST